MTLENQIADATHQAQLDNARLINRLRLAGVAAFAITVVGVVSLGDDSWATELQGLGIYFFIALLLWVFAERNARILWLSRFGIPLVDIPMVTAVQLFSLNSAAVPGQNSEFSISIFVCLLMLSALTLSTFRICVALGLSIIAEQILQAQAGIGVGGRFLSAIVMIFATWICVYAGKNRIDLVRGITSAETRRRRLQRYFSPGIGDMLEKYGDSELEEGKECELTIIFTDIRGFTAISERLGSRETVSLLNAFHAKMVEALFRHAGTLDKYMGDGLLAYFNAPIGQSDHAERAIRCALDMQQAIATMNIDLPGEGIAKLRVGIGIHTGRAIVGDIGAPSRREFTAIGDAVNIASRVEQMTKDIGAEILISQTTAALAPDELTLKEAGEFPIRGRSEPLKLFIPVVAERRGGITEPPVNRKA
jgi:adenylate cyclase